MAEPAQKPLELILARNFLSSLSTPAMLVNAPGDVIFFNEAAGELLGSRFEETGSLPAQEWLEKFGPVDESGEPIPIDEQPVTKALRAKCHFCLPLNAVLGVAVATDYPSSVFATT